MSQQPSLSTERLILRPFRLDDAKSVQQIAGRKEIADTTLNVPHPYPDGVAEAWINTHPASFESGEDIVFAITLKKTGQLIGAINLEINKRFNNAILGYWLDPNFWNQGYMTEAAKEMLHYGFEERKLHKIHASHITRNPASGKVMEKIGMQKEGLLREHTFRWGKYEDSVVYGVLGREY